MPAKLIQVTLVAPVPDLFLGKKLPGQIAINTDLIQSVETRTADTVSAGVTLIKYRWATKNHFQVANLYVSETRAALITASNANVVAT